MSFLDDLLRGAQDTASRAWDEINQNDNGKSWNQRTAQPAPKKKTAPKKAPSQAQMFLEELPKATNTVGNAIGKTLLEGSGKLTNQGLGIIENTSANVLGELQKAMGDTVKGNKTIADTKKHVDDKLLKQGAGLFGTGGVYNSTDSLHTANPKDVLVKAGGTGLQSLAETLPVAAGAKVLKGTSPALSKFIQGTGLGLGQGAAYSSGSQLSKDGKIDTNQLLFDTASSGLLGGTIPLAARAAETAAPAIKKTIDTIGKNQRDAFLKNASQHSPLTTIRPEYINPSNKQLDPAIISQHKKAILNGQIDPIVVSPDNTGYLNVLDGDHRLAAYLELGVDKVPTKAVTQQQLRMMKQGGYAQVPVTKGTLADTAPQFVDNALTKKAKAGKQNLSPDVQAGLDGSHAIRNTKALQDEAILNADNSGIDATISSAHDALAVPMGKIDDTTVAHVQQAIERADASGRTKDAIDLHDALSEHLTKQGQTIQAASLLYRLSPQGLFYKGMKDLKKAGAKVTPELQTQLQDLTTAIKSAPNQDAKERATAAFHKLVADNLPQYATKNVISVWKAGLLSGAKTQGGNFVSNGTFGALKKVADLPSTAIDMGISAFTKERTKALTAKGIASGVKEGASKGIDTMKTGIDARNITGNKYEIHGEINFKNPVIQKVFGSPSNLVFRSMGAADQPFYYAAFRNNLNELAKVEGINKGLKGKELSAFAKNTVANPSTKMAEAAKNGAEKAVLGQDNKIASAITGLTNKFPAAGVLVPFVKVPTNFIGRVLDYTPVGAVAQAVKQIRTKKFDQKALSEALGEATTGSAVIFLGAELANNNMLSGQYPSGDAKEAQRWKAEGITPNSVKMHNPVTNKDEWIGLNYLGPVGLLFGAGKDFHDASAKGDSGTIASIAGLGKNLTGQSFLTGFSGFSNAINDPQRNAKSFVNSQAGSVIPSWINDQANLFDSKQRETNTVTDSMKARTPGLRNTLPVKQDVYGNDLSQRTNPMNQWLNPLKPSENISSPTLAEVNRLHTVDAANKDLQVTPTQLDKAVSFGGTGTDGKAVPPVKLTDTQRHDLQKQIGQATQEAWGQMIVSDKYKALNDTDKAAALNSLRSKVTEAEQARFAMANSMGQYAQDFTGKKKRLSSDANTILTGQPDFTKFAKADNGSTSATISPNLAKNYKATLDEFDALDSTEREKKIYKETDAEFRYEAAKYENKKASGTLTQAEAIKAEDKLAKLQAGSKFSKDTRDLYSLSKKQLTSLIDQGKITDKQAQDILAYGDALKGIDGYNKFKDKNGNVAIRPKAKGGSTKKKGTGKAKAGSKKQLPSDNNTSTISLVANLSKKAASAKVTKKQLPSGNGKIAARGIQSYKKAAKTNVSMTRKA